MYLIGDLLSFSIIILNDKPNAINILLETRKYTGIVQIYNEYEKYGYIICDDVIFIHTYGNFRKIYLNSKDSNNCKQNDIVSFIIINVKGTLQARNVNKIIQI